MKNIGLIVGIAIGLSLGVWQVQKAYSLEENRLYSQESLKMAYEASSQNQELITRNQAILKVRTVIKAWLGVDLSSDQLNMQMNLYKDGQGYDAYRWNMHWSNKDLTKKYTCYMNAHSGQILYIYAEEMAYEEQRQVRKIHLSNEAVCAIVMPFAKSMGISLQDYQIEDDWASSQQQNDLERYQRYTFAHKKDENKSFIVEIDKIKACVVEYVLREKG